MAQTAASAGEERTMRLARYAHVEWKYAEWCLAWSQMYLTTSDWYCGPNLRWLYTFEPALYRRYAKERHPAGWTALDALWHVGLKEWLAEARELYPYPPAVAGRREFSLVGET